MPARDSLAFAFLALAIATGCDRGDAPSSARPSLSEPPQPPSELELDPNSLLAAGTPTLIVGTLGDDRADRSMRAQAELVRTLFPGSTIVEDTSFDASVSHAWPSSPVVFGGAHVNRAVRSLGAALPLHIDADRLAVGGQRFDGRGYRVIAAIPAGAAHPAFVLYAGTGTPGIADINNVRHGADAVLIGDAFGRLCSGRWERAGGTIVARLEPPARRIAWRSVERAVAGVPARIAFPEMLPAAADEAAVVDAIARGLARSVERLGVSSRSPLTIYVYPDRRSKESLTGDGGDGHAMPLAMALHVLRADPSAGGALELLVAHEATHVLAAEGWGATSSPLLGEGLAVWVSGHYGGLPLSAWADRLGARPAAATLLPLRAFRTRPESETYPFAGLLVEAMAAQVGLAAVRDHLYGAPADGWGDACVRAGTTAARLDEAVARR